MIDDLLNVLSDGASHAIIADALAKLPEAKP